MVFKRGFFCIIILIIISITGCGERDVKVDLTITDTASSTQTSTTTPPLNEGEKSKRITYSNLHNIKVIYDGYLYEWGITFFNEYGDSTKELNISKSPYQVMISDFNETILNIVGDLILTTEGNAYYLRRINDKEIFRVEKCNIDENISEIFCINYDSYLLLSETGGLYAAGTNRSGQLGSGDTASIEIVEPYKIPINDEITKVYTAKSSVYAVSKSGVLYSWGMNQVSELGVDSQELPVLSPTMIEFKYAIQDIYITPHTALILTDKGKLYSSGYGFREEDTSSTFIPILLDKVVKEVAVGYSDCYILTQDNEIFLYSRGTIFEADQNIVELMDNKKVKKLVGQRQADFDNYCDDIAVIMEDDTIYYTVSDTIHNVNLGKISDLVNINGDFIALTENNEVYAWGSYGSDYLREKTDEPIDTPRKIEFKNPID